MANFTSDLCNRVRSNPEFVRDLTALYVQAVHSLLGADRLVKEGASSPLNGGLSRLIESASILAQDESQDSVSIAQRIALMVSSVTEDHVYTRACEHILATLGNFPAMNFLQSRRRDSREVPELPPLLDASDYVRREFNSVEFGAGRLALTDFQFSIWQDLQRGDGAAVSAPTSAGKTFVVREFLVQRVRSTDSLSIVYVVPSRALMAEVQENFIEELGIDNERLRISSVPTPDALMRSKQVFVLTQERLLTYLDDQPDAQFDYVIVDEAQQIGDGSRGMILEECLDRLVKTNPRIITYFLSPGLDNLSELGGLIDRADIRAHVSSIPPVVSNKIVVRVDSRQTKRLHLELLSDGRRVPLARLEAERGFADPKTRLAATCLELGASGASLIYAGGPAEAETTAAQIASGLRDSDNEKLVTLARFVREHVHRDYTLSHCVRRGVGFHYGSMPTLLRQALEQAFKDGLLQYLVCTTTLFHGVNLPARNVFVDRATRGARGRASQLESRDILNFLGRAGRLGKDIAGNVFLVNYDEWGTDPVSERSTFSVRPALRSTLAEHFDEIVGFLSESGHVDVPREIRGEIEAAAGLLLVRFRKGGLENTLRRSAPGLAKDAIAKITTSLEKASGTLTVPDVAVARNWLVSPWKLQVLYDYFIEKIEKDEADSLLPSHPLAHEAYQSYVRYFRRIEKYLRGVEQGRSYVYIATQALAWMRGTRLPEMIDRDQENADKKRVRKRDKKGNSNTAVRRIFDLIEKQLRFTYVQLSKAYADCLEGALTKTGRKDLLGTMFPVALGLELGACTKTAISLIELGLSRISAQSIAELIPGSEYDAPSVRKWLAEQVPDSLAIAAVVLDELVRLKLVRNT